MRIDRRGAGVGRCIRSLGAVRVEPLGFDTGGDVLILAYRARCFPRREGPPVDYVAHNDNQAR
jgi:hypothetical protein